MKKTIIITVVLMLVAFVGYRGYRIANTKSFSPKETVNYNYQDCNISVTYGRPYKKGRLIFGEAKHRAWLPNGKFWTAALRLVTGLPASTGALVPNGEYWRLGANEATEISFSKNINFAGELVNARRYRMYAVPNAASWQVSLNRGLGQWGYAEPDYSLDVVHVNVPVEMFPTETEQFTIKFNSDSLGVVMNFIWDKTLVRVPITIQ